MYKYDAIESGIEKNDIKALRRALGNICYTNRNFSNGEFDEVVCYVESKGIKLKDDALVGDPTISSQKSAFTDEDFAMAVLELKENFCDERIQDVKTIGKKLYTAKPEASKQNSKSPKETMPKTEKKEGANQEKHPNQQSHQKENKSTVFKLVAVGIILLIIALLKRK